MTTNKDNGGQTMTTQAITNGAEAAVSIIITPNYYDGTRNAPRQALVTYGDVRDATGDDMSRWAAGDNEPAIWPTHAAAQAWIDERQSGDYCTAHGEAGRPGYEIVAEDNPWSESDCCKHSAELDADDWEMIDEDDAPSLNINVEYAHAANDYEHLYWVWHRAGRVRIRSCSTAQR